MRTANDPVIENVGISKNVSETSRASQVEIPTSLWMPAGSNRLGVSDEKWLMIEKVRAGKVQDKIVQTEQTYDFKAARPRTKLAHWSMQGAYTHVSDWDPKG